MYRRSAKLFSALLTLAAFTAIFTHAKARTETGVRESRGLRPAAGLQMAQNIYPYPGGGYYYPPGYDPRQPRSDSWGWTGRGWGNTYSGGWQVTPPPGSGGRNHWGGTPQGGRGNRW